MKELEQNPLSQFSGVTDPRIDQHKKYPLAELLFLCVNAVACGYRERKRQGNASALPPAAAVQKGTEFLAIYRNLTIC